MAFVPAEPSPASDEPSPPSESAPPEVRTASPDPRASSSARADDAWEGEYADAVADLNDKKLDLLFADIPSPQQPDESGMIRGRVVAVHGDDVFVDAGGKHQGVVPLSQLEKRPDVGETLSLIVDRFDADAGLLILSREGAIREATWQSLAVGAIVEGRVTGMNKGGLEVDLKGIRGFMPASHVDVVRMKDISLLIGERVRCEVIEVNKREKNVLLSRRRVLEAERAAAREKLLAELEDGQVRRGVVSRLTDFGVFVDLGGVDGLLHISDMSWSELRNPGDAVSPGQEIQVKVLKVDGEKGRISLGLKQLTPDPWKNVAETYRPDARVRGRVTRVLDFGAFVELEPGVEGLIPISEMSWVRRLRHPSEVVREGQIVEVAVLRVEPERKRISLGIKQVEGDPWKGVAADFPQNATVTGKVCRLAQFGAFVELRPGVDGLLHISEMSDKRIKSPQDVVQEGQEVSVRVLNVDEAQRRISLTMKSLEAAAPAADAPVEAAAARRKRKKPLRGGLSSHFEW